MALLEKQLQIRQSAIPGAGMGLFTTLPIAKGAKIVEYKGKIKTWKEAQENSENLYIFYVNDEHVIDACNYTKGLARYVNDAKGLTKVKGINNNAEFVCSDLKVFVISTKNIPAGGEIYVGYGKDYWRQIRTHLRLAAMENS